MQLNAYGNLSGSFMVVWKPEINMYTLIETLTDCEMAHNNLLSIFKDQLKLKSTFLAVH